MYSKTSVMALSIKKKIPSKTSYSKTCFSLLEVNLPPVKDLKDSLLMKVHVNVYFKAVKDGFPKILLDEQELKTHKFNFVSTVWSERCADPI